MATRANLMQDQLTGSIVDHYGVAHTGHGLTDRFGELQALADSLEESMPTAPINLTGSFTIRVDCNCNAYSKESVEIPYRLIYEAVLADPFDQSAKLALVSDPRITATKVSEPGVIIRPSAQFKLLHIHEAAASMRAAQLIPFSPFMRDEVKNSFREQPNYLDWLADYNLAVSEADGE